MSLKPIDLTYFNRKDRNVHECIVAASMKIEFNKHVELITTKTESEGEENDINPDQLRISLEFEKRPKPTDVAIGELLADKMHWRFKEVEEIVVPKEDEEPTEEE
jgi:hypothetical protein